MMLRYFALCLWTVYLPVLADEKTHGVTSAWPIEFSGFVDAQGRLTDPSEDSGFTINDGALYLDTGNDTYQLHIDLPFFGGGENNDFDFAEEKAQAYLSGSHSNGFTWQLGQFDSIIGFEDNDSVGLDFATGAGIAGAPFPSTHTGFLFGVSKEKWSISGLVANQADAGTLEGDVDLGTVITWDTKVHGYLSILTHDAGDGRDMVAEFSVGTQWGSMAIDTAMAYTSPDGGKKGWTLLLQGVYDFHGPWSWAWRLEAADDQADFDEAEAATLGLRRQLNKQFMLKLDAVFQELKVAPGDDAEDVKTLALSGIARF